MPTDTKLNQLIINQLTQEQYDEAKAAGTLSDTELYITDSDDDALTNNNISNCITYIPQDIKLELNNGTLTLKAGSKVYIPNGVGVFDIVTIASDKSYFYTSETLQGLLWITNHNNLDFVAFQNCYSGQVAPQNSGLWYDTANNLMKFSSDGGNTWVVQKSLPLASVSFTSGIGATSIDQVFNGFGYIGSTIFALPGVKGLIPNGRNADGSLKSIEFTTSSVKIITYDSQTFNEFDLCFNGNSFDWYTNFNVKEDNYCYNGNSKITQTVNVGRFRINQSSDNGKIAWFTPKTVFHALDYNDKSTISGWSMPSSRYIDLTLGASGSTYTAPVNGYFYLVKVAGKDMGDIRFINRTKDIFQEVLPKTSTNWLYVRMEAQKGDVFEIVYGATGETKKFRFIFAEGEN